MSSKFDQAYSAFCIDSSKTPRQTSSPDNKDIEHLLSKVHHFEQPMDLELELDDNWKERFGEQEIEFLTELSDYLRHLNEINYLYEFWGWQEATKQLESPEDRVELLDGREYQADLKQIDEVFSELINNEGLLQ